MANLFMPIVGAMRRELLSGGYIQADETPVDVQSGLEAEAKAAGLGAAERLGLRREKAEPIVEGLKERIESSRASTLAQRAGQSMRLRLGPLGSAEALSGLRPAGTL
jgi:hypothetical protein